MVRPENTAPKGDGDARPVPARALDAALEAAELGYPVFPLRPNSKAPATAHGKDDATTDPEVLRRMFAAPRNLGIAWPPGVLAVDLDVPKSKGDPLPGAAEYADAHAGDYEVRYPELSTAPRIRTRADGVQWVVRLPDGVKVPSKTGVVVLAGGGGIDLRGDGRTYTAAPPSTVPPGRYLWERDLVPVAALPVASPELLEHLTAHAHGRNGKAPTDERTATAPDDDGGVKTIEGPPLDYAAGILKGTRERLGAVENGRNEACYLAALTLGRWVGGYQRAGLPGLTREAAYAALLEAMQANGDHADDPQKAEGTIDRGLDDGIRSAYAVTVTLRTRAYAPQDGREGAPQGDGTPNTTLRVQASPSAPQPATVAHVQPHPDLATFDRTDLGNAERLAHTYGHLLRYVGGLGWYTWTGKHWEQDTQDHVLRLAALTMRATAATAEVYAEDSDQRQKLRQHAHASQSAARLRSMVDLILAAAPALYAKAEDLDADPWVLNVENGLLDLRTGTLHPHDRTALCTKVAPVVFNLDAQHPALDALLDVLDQDGRADYLRAIAGQALTGKQAKAIYIWTGPSGTVKSTTADALAAVLGPYFAPVEPSTLLVNKHGHNAGGARADLVALRGARLSVAAELPNGGRLDSELVKRLTGGDWFSVRAPYARETFRFKPTHTLVVHSNHDPRIDWTDSGMRARVVPVPFEARPSRPDPRVRETLLTDPAARSAVLLWAIAGAVEWHRNGERDPEQPDLVKSRKTDYLREQDPFTAWAEDALEVTGDDSVFTSSKALSENYQRWCEANGEKPQTKLSYWLRENMTPRGAKSGRRGGTRVWFGLRLRGGSGT
jgi:P4 family phage/plasmid primase-like protien